MNGLLRALNAEGIKLKRSPMVWVSFAAFSLAPLMGAVFMIMLKYPDTMAQTGAMATKAELMGMVASWDAYLQILIQAIGVGGILLFGFVASWLFGREYTEGTAKDLLALPTSRSQIIHAKFCLYIAWCGALALTNLLLGWGINLLLELPTLAPGMLDNQLVRYLLTTLLTVLLGTPLAFLALWGKGYLMPLGFVALTLVVSQVVAAAGWGTYFPWAVPGLYSGAGGAFGEHLNWLSFATVALLSLLGYLATITYWKFADQVK